MLGEYRGNRSKRQGGMPQDMVTNRVLGFNRADVYRTTNGKNNCESESMNPQNPPLSL